MSSSEFSISPPPPGTIAPIVPQTPVQAAIARAATATGVDFTYLLAQARLESGLDPNARARTSSARGLYQFTGSTWLNTLGKLGADYGLDSSGLAHDPAARARALALRQDPQLSALMAGELANDNRTYLYGALGREPDHAELYLAHFLGPDAAARFLTALSSDPGQSAAALLPKAAAANQSIFYAGSAPRSVGQVMDVLRARLDAAKAERGPGAATSGSGSGSFVPQAANPAAPMHGGPIAREFAGAAASGGVGASGSMADTLKAAFGTKDGTDTTMPANVRAAYGRIRAAGM